MNKDNHVVFFSGGAGSYQATKRVLEKVDTSQVHLLFTDTQIEDKELYRFMLDAFEFIYKEDLTGEKFLVQSLTETHDDLDKRKRELLVIQDSVNRKITNVHWIRYEVNAEGISPWDIFYNDRFIGSSRVAKCSTIIKQRLARDYIKDNFDKNSTHVYLGIDWMEEHRKSAPTKNWLPYVATVNFPMCESPYLLKDDIVKSIELDGIRIPIPYLQGQAHLNCGSFCVRGGHGHFAKLLETNPALYEYHASKERILRSILQEKNGNEENYSILKKTTSGNTVGFSLDELRDQLNNTPKTVDLFDIGGCGCFVTDDKEEDIEFNPDDRWGLRDLKIRKYIDEK